MGVTLKTSVARLVKLLNQPFFQNTSNTINLISQNNAQMSQAINDF